MIASSLLGIIVVQSIIFLLIGYMIVQLMKVQRSQRQRLSQANARLDLEQANVLLSHSLQAIRDGLSESRRALKELRAKPLDDLGLALAVRALAEAYATRFDFRLELTIQDDLGQYPSEVEQSVYRIAQEALTNIAEHAVAQRAQLLLKRDRDHLRQPAMS